MFLIEDILSVSSEPDVRELRTDECVNYQKQCCSYKSTQRGWKTKTTTRCLASSLMCVQSTAVTDWLTVYCSCTKEEVSVSKPSRATQRYFKPKFSAALPERHPSTLAALLRSTLHNTLNHCFCLSFSLVVHAGRSMYDHNILSVCLSFIMFCPQVLSPFKSSLCLCCQIINKKNLISLWLVFCPLFISFLLIFPLPSPHIWFPFHFLSSIFSSRLRLNLRSFRWFPHCVTVKEKTCWS